MTWMRLISFTGLALAAALLATVAQAVMAMRAWQEGDPLAPSAVTAMDMKREVTRWRPVRRWRHRKVVRRVLRESPGEARAYRRLAWTLWSWSLLAAASALALIGHLVDS